MAVIAIDFDGTCVTHEFPLVGKDIGAAPVIRELLEAGHKIILYTMRSNFSGVKTSDPSIHSESGRYLDDAVNWFKKNELRLYSKQVNPSQKSWTQSPKCYAELYIDDAALGIPLMADMNKSSRPFVDWVEVRKMLIQRGFITKNIRKQ